MSCSTCGGANPPGAGSRTASAGSGQAPCDNCIFSVSIINGSDDYGRPLLVDSANQFVNLPREERYLDEIIGNLDRLGNRVKIWIEQRRDTSLPIAFKVDPVDRNAGYSDQERQANPNYIHRPSVWANATGGGYNSAYQRMGLEREVQLAAAGGMEYTIKARCGNCGRIVTCGPVRAMRRIWYFVAAMVVDGTAVSVPNLTSFKDYFLELGIVMRELPRQTFPEFVYRGTDTDETTIRQRIQPPFRQCGGRGKPMHAMAFVFIDQIATKTAHVERDSMTLNRGTPYTVQLDDYLWYDMHGPEHEWFIEGMFYPSGLADIEVTRTMLTPLSGSSGNASQRDRLQLDTEAIFRILDSRSSGTPRSSVSGMLTLRVHTATEWCGGYTYSGTDYIVMATRSGWRTDDAGNIIQVMTHEFGHSIKLTPTTNRSDHAGLDHVETWYVERGHQGEHCWFNVSTDLPADGEYTRTHDREARCCMYGCSGRSTYRNMMRYCNNCANAAKKVDMHEGWSRSS